MSEIALIGKKIGMTREFYKSGQLVPVTVIKMEKARVIQVIEQDKRGYKAVQLGYGKIKNSKLTKSMKGYFSKKNTEAKRKLKEYRVENTENYKEGNEFGLEIFKDIKFVDTRSKTIGKGFAGAMKRHNFAGLRASHGVSISHRSHGSTGNSQDPGRVWKGKKMAGQMGNKKTTVQSLEVVSIDEDRSLILVKGGVPGSIGGWVEITDAKKKSLPANVPYPAGIDINNKDNKEAENISEQLENNTKNQDSKLVGESISSEDSKKNESNQNIKKDK